MGFWDGSGISWTVCKQSAPRSRQITTPTPHHSILTGRMLFLTPSEQCQSTEGITVELHWRLLCWQLSCSYQYAYKLIIVLIYFAAMRHYSVAYLLEAYL